MLARLGGGRGTVGRAVARAGAGGAGVVANGLAENLEGLPGHASVLSVEVPEIGHSILPGPGKMASVRIYSEIKERFGGRLDERAALWALEVYDEYVAEAKEERGSHPNIDILLDVKAGGGPYSVATVVVEE